MKRLLALLTLVASMAVAGLAAGPAGAVKFGEPDRANAYPWVGLMVAYDDAGNPLWRCTGSLLSADLFRQLNRCCESVVGRGLGGRESRAKFHNDHWPKPRATPVTMSCRWP